MPQPTDPAVSGLAWSPTADPSADWWTQRVYVNGVPTRRLDAAAEFSRAPGATPETVAALLAAVAPADGRTDARPPWYWDARVYFDGVPTPRRAVRAALFAAGVPAAGVAAFLDTAEFADGHYNEDQPRAGDGKFGSGGGSAKGKGGKGKKADPLDALGDNDPDFRKAVSQMQKTEAKHAGTVEKLADGGKVTDKALKDAHDHFEKWHGHHSEDLKAASGPDGAPAAGKEFDHEFHKGQAEKYGKHLEATTGELHKRTVAKEEKARAKDDAKHGATYDKLEAGHPVTRAQIQAAHDHYAKRYDAHGETLAKMAGKNGKNLLSIPPEVHGKLTDAMLESAGRHERLKGHLDAHDKAKAAAETAKKEKAETAKKEKAEQKAAARAEKKGAPKGKAAETPADKPAEKPAEKAAFLSSGCA